jgi:hypothetical protein
MGAVPVALSMFAETALVGLALALAGGYLVLRAIRTFGRRGSEGGCGSAGKPGCPAVNAADDLRRAARRAVRNTTAHETRTVR